MESLVKQDKSIFSLFKRESKELKQVSSSNKDKRNKDKSYLFGYSMYFVFSALVFFIIQYQVKEFIPKEQLIIYNWIVPCIVIIIFGFIVIFNQKEENEEGLGLIGVTLGEEEEDEDE